MSVMYRILLYKLVDVWVAFMLMKLSTNPVLTLLGILTIICLSMASAFALAGTWRERP